MIDELKIKKSNLNFTLWKDAVLAKVDEKINVLKLKIRPQRKFQILKENTAKEYLDRLHEKYVLVPIDKASNNIAVICKKFYVEVILKEIGKVAEGNGTYVDSQIKR